MSGQIISAVVGANFGDEGKGLAVDYFCSLSQDCLVIRHNGGAQAGHTVENEEKRFVFHQLSSGSFRHADTMLAETFYPDLFKLTEEASDFNSLAGFLPVIYADVSANITIIDDILLNMALETSRGSFRHGSCGMGVYEAVLRTRAGFGITVGEIVGMSERELVNKLGMIRREYTIPRLAALSLKNCGEYTELLKNENVLSNSAEGMLRGAALLIPSKGLKELSAKKQRLIFEGAQGLLLDWENERYLPHLTASRTGLHNPLLLCGKSGLNLEEAVYVMRSYVTRHGAGPLPYECAPDELGRILPDKTNAPNEWQGHLRFGFYPSSKELADTILDDLGEWQGSTSLFITHLNETDGMVRFKCGDFTARELSAEPYFNGKISSLYCSYSRFGSQTRKIFP